MIPRWRSYCQENMTGNPLTGLTPPYCCACPKPGQEIPTSYVVIFLIVNEVRGDCSVC